LGLALCACSSPAPGPPALPTLTSGNAALALSADATTLTFSLGGKALLTFGADAFQVGTVDDLTVGGDSFDPYWLFAATPPPPPTGLRWRSAAAGSAMKLVSSSATTLVLELDSTDCVTQVVFKAEAAGISGLLTATVTSQVVAYLRLQANAGSTEGFYGLGEWGDTVNQRGQLRPMQMEIANLESGDDENHVPVPLLLGTNGWGLFVQSERPGAFNVATATPTLIDVTYGTGTASASGLLFHLFAEAQPLDLLGHYYDVAGHPGLPAPWALGPLLWRGQIASQAQVLDDITQVRTLHLATSGMWFDRPYATGVETFDFNPMTFPDPPTMLQALHDGGFRYGVWQAPYTGGPSSSDPAPAQLAYALANAFFPPVTGLLLNSWGKPIDFTNPAAYGWWSSNLATYTEGYGVEGFKLDYGEDVVVGLYGQATPWQFADGEDELTMHYEYQLLYHGLHRDLLPAAGGLLLCRTGRWGDQVHGTIIWPGDLDATLNQQGDTLPNGQLAVGGLPAALMKELTLSASGFPFYASDTGGYRSAPGDNETWLRWIEANAIATGFENGDAPWEFNAQNGRTAQSLADYQKYASLHLRLFPYQWSYAVSMAQTGRPITRPFGLAFPSVGQHPNDEIVFGDSILSAPVVVAGETSRTVQLPPGTWYGWWDGAPQNGGAGGAQVTVQADLDTLPLFISAGGIVPMLRDTIDTLSPVAAGSSIDSFANDPGVLWVRVAPGPSTSFTVYDGTAITLSGGTSLAVTPGSLFTEGTLFEVIATPVAPNTVTTADGDLPQIDTPADLEAAIDGWTWEAATGGTLWIKVSGAATVSVR
jgi:alpha-D-xyloside xylohydrolase